MAVGVAVSTGVSVERLVGLLVTVGCAGPGPPPTRAVGVGVSTPALTPVSVGETVSTGSPLAEPGVDEGEGLAESSTSKVAFSAITEISSMSVGTGVGVEAATITAGCDGLSTLKADVFENA
jgi:hypothetical protein